MGRNEPRPARTSVRDACDKAAMSSLSLATHRSSTSRLFSLVMSGLLFPVSQDVGFAEAGDTLKALVWRRTEDER